MTDKKACKHCKNEVFSSLLNAAGVCIDCMNGNQGRIVAENAELKEEKKQQDELAKQELAARALCKRRLLPFVERMVPDYLAGWVHKDICMRLEKFSDDVEAKKSPRLALFMPPRHGKSQIASICFPAWHLGRNPRHEFIACSYSGALSMDFSRKVRQTLRDPSYTSVFKEIGLAKDSQSAEHWHLTSGGGYAAAGVGGAITGKGAHVLVIDDPVKNREDAESQLARQTTWDWFTSTAYTRLAPGAGVLIIQTRWHDDDLSGRLLTAMAEDPMADQYEVIVYPAIAVQDEKYRKKGQALHPARYPIEALEGIKRTIGPRDWAALYQQNPVAEDGAYFSRDMVRYYGPKDLPDRDAMTVYIAWDLAIGQKEQNDYSVGIACGVDRQDNLYVLDVMRGRWDAMELVEKMLDFFVRWQPDRQGIEKEKIEMAIGPFLQKRKAERNLYEAHFEPLKPGKRDKVARARPLQGRMEQGKVYFPKHAEFSVPLINELLRFPSGVHDDQVDALAWIGQMLSEMTTVPEPKVVKKSWRDNLHKYVKDVDNYISPMSA